MARPTLKFVTISDETTILTAKECAAAAGAHLWKLHHARNRVARGAWFSLGPLRVRELLADAPAVPQPSADACLIRLALDRGENGVYSEDDLRVARTWAARIRREQQELAAVEAGTADLTVQNGRVCVLRRDLTVERSTVDWCGAMKEER